MNLPKYLFLSAALLCYSAPLWAMGSHPPFQASQTLRVAVSDGEKTITLKVAGPYEIRTLHTGELLKEGDHLEEVLTPTLEGLLLGGDSFNLYGIRVIPKREASLALDGRRFRGIVDILRQSNMTLLVVNHLDIEKYLYGVLPHEIPDHWPDQMLEIQAILARSYALFKKMEHRKEEYDVVSSVLSQRYGGREEEIERARRAVDRTAGQVLTTQGTLFPTFYHSTCGGHTEDAVVANLWKKILFPLRGVRCTTCDHSPFYRWERSFSLEDVAFRLRKSGRAVPPIRRLRLDGRTASGRAKAIVIEHEKGETTIPAPEFRLSISPMELRSIKFDLAVKDGRVTFKGYGWGHGAGLCQWGAEGMVARGFSVNEILSFYYPGTEIRELPNIPWNEP